MAIPPRRDADQRYSVEYTPTSFWQTALYRESGQDPGSNLKYEQPLENIFRFSQGQHWLDAV